MILNVKTIYQRPARLIPAPAAVNRTPHRRVVLLMDTSTAYGRGLLQGIAKYNRERGNWFTCVHGNLASQHTRDGHIDGLIVGTDQLTGAAMTQVARTGAAVVSLHPSQEENAAAASMPYLGVDDEQVVRIAAQHLIDRGVEHFGFCGGRRTGNPALARRGELFRQFIEAAGHASYAYPGAADNSEQAQQRLAEWITAQPKPLGLMTANDRWGLRVLDACRLAGVEVPDDVAAIGVDNDEALCDLAIPPLSSVDVNAEGIGYDGAALLDRMMSGEDVAGHDATLLAPRGVVPRQSSDTVASEDEDVSRAVKFIRERACSAMGLQVEDVLGYTGTSRASLQHRMKKLLGHTIHQEIQRARLDRAKELLAMSGMTIKQVARESGFASVQYMTRVFRAGTGETPARYRSRRSV